MIGAALASAAFAGDAFPTSLGPLVLRSEDAELRLRLAGQLQAELDATDELTLTERLRRLRPGLEAGALDGRLLAALQLNLVPGATELLDAWGAWAPSAAFQLRAGQFKVPFTRYRDQSYTGLVLSDWPVAAKAFGAERQLGIAAGDGRPGRASLGWSLGVFSGSNARKAFATGVADAYGISLGNPSDLATGTTTTSPHPELVGRLTAGTPRMDASTDFDHDGGSARVLAGLSLAWDAAPDPTVETTGRGALEALLKVDHLSATAVGYLGLVGGDDGSLAAGLSGGTAEVAWRATPRLGLAALGSRVDVLPDLRDQARAWADAQIAGATADEQADLAEALGEAGTLRSSSELGAGVTWFVHGTAVDLQADGSWLVVVREEGTTSAGRARLQAQLVF